MIKKVNLRVPYAETDQMGVVYYSNYLIWFEKGRNEYFRDLGIPYTELEKENLFIPVVEAHCRYFASAKYDDLIDVYTQVAEVKNATIKFEYNIKRKNTLLANGYTIHAFINKEGRPVKIPLKIKEAFLKTCK